MLALSGRELSSSAVAAILELLLASSFGGVEDGARFPLTNILVIVRLPLGEADPQSLSPESRPGTVPKQAIGVCPF